MPKLFNYMNKIIDYVNSYSALTLTSNYILPDIAESINRDSTKSTKIYNKSLKNIVEIPDTLEKYKKSITLVDINVQRQNIIDEYIIKTHKYQFTNYIYTNNEEIEIQRINHFNGDPIPITPIDFVEQTPRVGYHITTDIDISYLTLDNKKLHDGDEKIYEVRLTKKRHEIILLIDEHGSLVEKIKDKHFPEYP